MQATAIIDFDDVPRVVEAIFAIDNPIVSEAYSKFDEDIGGQALRFPRI